MRIALFFVLVLGGCLHSGAGERRIQTDRPEPRLLPLPKEDDCFFFAIFGDRTGGQPSGLKVLEQAVADTNLLDPDLVMTVGDLIQGYNAPAQWQRQAVEFKGIMNDLAMPWFPVAGNHDVYQRLKKGAPMTNRNAEHYEKEFGPLWYSFQHKKSAFIVLYSDEGDPVTRRASFRNPEHQKMSPEQFAWLDRTLQNTSGAEHVFVFLHHPRWRKAGYGDDWERVHARLAAAGNVTAVFAGHIHRMVYDGVRDGIEYFTLATTGGSYNHRLPAAAGYLHHFNLVTVRPEGIKVTTIPVGTVMDPKRLDDATVSDVRKLAPQSHGIPVNPITVGTGGDVDTDYRLAIDNPCDRPIEVTVSAASADPRWQFTPDHTHVTIPPGEKRSVEFRFFHPADGLDPAFALPEIETRIDYLGAGIRIQLPARQLAIPGKPPATAKRPTPPLGYLKLDRGFLRVPMDRFELPKESLPELTLECHVRLRDAKDNHGLLAGRGFRLRIVAGIPELALTTKAGKLLPIAYGEPLEPNRWHHLAAVFDGRELCLYSNGQRVARHATGAATALAVDRGDILIGAIPAGNKPPRHRARLDLDRARITLGSVYSDESFQPPERQDHEITDATILFLPLDRNLGPWVMDLSPRQAHPVRSGQATCVIDR